MWKSRRSTAIARRRQADPGPKTRYRRAPRKHLGLAWVTEETAIAYDHKSDGMYPLLSIGRSLMPAQVLDAHKRQPKIEKRFEQLKTVHEIAPVFLENDGQSEAFFLLYFVGLLLQALIERETRRAMLREGIPHLPPIPSAAAAASQPRSGSSACSLTSNASGSMRTAHCARSSEHP